MNRQTAIPLIFLRELAAIIVSGSDANEIVSKILHLLQDKVALVSGRFIMQYADFWSAQRLLALKESDYSNLLDNDATTDVFNGEFGDKISAELLSEETLNERFPSRDLFCETHGNIATIRIPLKYRQRFIGFFSFERETTADDGNFLTSNIAAIMEVIGVIVADVAETRFNQAAERQRLIAQNQHLQSRLEPVSPNLIGESDLMHEVYGQIRQVAATDATVLIRGASGTGKELVARSLVDLSSRASRPFLTVNCAALPETLIESELFGHEKGAFTGAVERRIGRAEAADGGTLFLDEIGDLTPATQVKLLRFLQEKTFSRVGSNTELRSNVRFIAATSRNLEELIEKKLFREDLYYRLNIFTIQMPDLAARRSDILILAKHFAEKFNIKYGKEVKKFSPEITAALIDWKWPGNVRELENCIERAVLTATDDTIRVKNLPPSMRPIAADEEKTEDIVLPESEGKTLDELTQNYRRAIIEAALKKAGGNKSAAARTLGLTPRMMYYECRQRS